MDRTGGLEGLEVLSEVECLALLVRGCVGRLGFIVGGRPVVLPVNYSADELGVVVFRTAAGSLLTAVAHQPVAFEIDGVDPAHRTGWSVAVQGEATELTELGTPGVDRLRAMPVVTWAPGQRDPMVRDHAGAGHRPPPPRPGPGGRRRLVRGHRRLSLCV